MEFKQYRGKSILAWLSYNANYEDLHGGINNRCYVYPRVMNSVNYAPIDSTDFPKLGRIEVRIQGGDSADVLPVKSSQIHSHTSEFAEWEYISSVFRILKSVSFKPFFEVVSIF